LLARLHGAHEQVLILPPIVFDRANTILLRLFSADSTPLLELWFQCQFKRFFNRLEKTSGGLG